MFASESRMAQADLLGSIADSKTIFPWKSPEVLSPRISSARLVTAPSPRNLIINPLTSRDENEIPFIDENDTDYSYIQHSRQI